MEKKDSIKAYDKTLNLTLKHGKERLIKAQEKTLNLTLKHGKEELIKLMTNPKPNLYVNYS